MSQYFGLLLATKRLRLAGKVIEMAKVVPHLFVYFAAPNSGAMKLPKEPLDCNTLLLYRHQVHIPVSFPFFSEYHSL